MKNETISKRVGNLMSVKSLVTLALTAVFAVMTVRQAISQDYMPFSAVLTAFYSATQSPMVPYWGVGGCDSTSGR